MEEIRVVPMTLEHIDGVLEIEKCSFATPWSKEAFIQEVMENKLARYHVAIKEEKVIAYGGMWFILDEAHITNIAVHPFYRGKGVGSRVLASMIEEARKHNIHDITLEVRPSNQAALKLYEKYAFQVIGRRKGYYEDTGEDALIMWKR